MPVSQFSDVKRRSGNCASALRPGVRSSCTARRASERPCCCDWCSPEFADVLYSPQNPTPQSLYRNLAQSLLELEHPVLTKSCPQGTESLQAKTATSVKGLVRDALHDSKYLVIVDHLVRPSQALAASIRELMLNWSVPVVAVSRSAHMEDVGSFCRYFPIEPRGSRSGTSTLKLRVVLPQAVPRKKT